MKTIKKRSSPKFEVFFPRNLAKTKKKKKKDLHLKLGLYSAGICRIYSCWLALDRFIIQRSNLDAWTSKSRWGTLNLDRRMLTLDGGCVFPRPPYNLSTDCPQAENRAIFWNLRLRGQSRELDLRGQRLQNVSSRPRTFLRTPSLTSNIQ